MNFEAGFLSDNTYGVKHINRLVRSLVTKGIVDYPFPEDESDIGAFNINGFIQFLSEDGVIPETCKSMLVEKTDTGYVLNPGMAFLDNGIYIFVEEAQEFSCEPRMKVYWMHNSLTDKVEFMCAADYPASGSYLPLAEILADGAVSNVRKSARAKLPGMVSDYNRTKFIAFSEEVHFETIVREGYNSGYYCTLEFDLGGNCYNYLLFTRRYFWALVNLNTGEIQGIRKADYTVINHNGSWNGSQSADFSSDFVDDDDDYAFDICEISESGKMILKVAKTTLKSSYSNLLEFNLYAF